MGNLTINCRRLMFEARASNLVFGGSRLRSQHGGIFVPSLWRESGSGNARGCPKTVLSSRRQSGLKASLAAIINAVSEAVMTAPIRATSAPKSNEPDLILALAREINAANAAEDFLAVERLVDAIPALPIRSEQAAALATMSLLSRADELAALEMPPAERSRKQHELFDGIGRLVEYFRERLGCEDEDRMWSFLIKEAMA